MTREQVEALAQLLPAEGGYFRLAFGIQSSAAPPSELERIDKALMDPSFGWNVPASYAAAGLPLPNLEWPSAMVRAHRYLSNPTLRDDNLVFALTLNLPENGAQRGLMRALSLCEDGTEELRADWFGCEIDAVRLFNELLWNVRDRRGEPFYLAHILKDRGSVEQGLRERSQALFGHDLVMLASRTGKAQSVLAAAGISRPSTHGVTAATRIEQVLHKLLALAATGLANGKMSAQENRALALLVKYRLLPEMQEASAGIDSLSLFRFSHGDLQPLYEDLSRRLGLERAMIQETVAANRPSSV